ncbi:MAG: hypothetical protein ACP5G6_06960 [Conexivisphaera sp.]
MPADIRISDALLRSSTFQSYISPISTPTSISGIQMAAQGFQSYISPISTMRRMRLRK